MENPIAENSASRLEPPHRETTEHESDAMGSRTIFSALRASTEPSITPLREMLDPFSVCESENRHYGQVRGT